MENRRNVLVWKSIVPMKLGIGNGGVSIPSMQLLLLEEGAMLKRVVELPGFKRGLHFAPLFSWRNADVSKYFC